MALTGTIPSATVKTALGASMYNWRELIAHANVNKWSRYKPVIGAWPGAASGKYGFNLPTNWNYNQPRGGGAYGEDMRAGDFAGYEHDKDIAGPVIYVIDADVNVPAITPTLASNTAIGEWIFKRNTSADNVRIIPSDLGLNSYYYGVKLTFGSVNYYKTGAQVSSASGQEMHFDAQLTNLATRTFLDFPNYDYRGIVTWNLFISSTQAAAWTTSAPSDIIYLPSGTYGSKTIVTTGTFTLADWIIASQDGTTQCSALTWTYNDVNYKSVYLYKPGDANHMGIYAGCISGGYIMGHWNWQAWIDGHDVSNDFDSWDNGVEVRLFPIAQNNSGEINSNGQFGLSNQATGGTIINNLSIALKHENGTPPSATAWECYDYTLDVTTINSGLSIGSTSLNITWSTDPDSVSGTNIPVYVFRDGNIIGNTTMNKISGNDVTGDITINTLQPGDIITVYIGAL